MCLLHEHRMLHEKSTHLSFYFIPVPVALSVRVLNRTTSWVWHDQFHAPELCSMQTATSSEDIKVCHPQHLTVHNQKARKWSRKVGFLQGLLQLPVSRRPKSCRAKPHETKVRDGLQCQVFKHSVITSSSDCT